MHEQHLILVCGIPGTGKTSIAEALAGRLSFPVFSKDWLEATLAKLRRSDGQLVDTSREIGDGGYELMTMLAGRQLDLGQSAILDGVAQTNRIRERWAALAHPRSAVKWSVIECVCSDSTKHRVRLEDRRRGIPGWHEVSWERVESFRSIYEPWSETSDRCVLDSVEPLQSNLETALEHIYRPNRSNRTQ